MAIKQPNILLIVSDDHGYADLSYKKVASDVHTPALDRLAREGMSFNRAYVSAPICSPSRCGLISGCYQQRWGAKWFNSSQFPPQSQAIFPKLMKEAGYRTGYFGKVHYGPDQYGSYSCPDQHGFDESLYGLAALGMGRLHYLHHGEEYIQEKGAEYAQRHGVHPLVKNGEKISCDRHVTEVFSEAAADFIAQDDEKPYFCMLCFNAVHNFCWQLPEEYMSEHGLERHSDFDPSVDQYVDWYDGAVAPNLKDGRAYYLGQLDLMDQAIGRLLDLIDERGERENTLIVYMTDNGGSNCNYGDNTPLFGKKYTLYEGGIRVPFICSWMGQIREGSQCDALVSSMDLLPTCLDFAGLNLAEQAFFDGKSLRQVFSEESQVQHQSLFFDTGFQWAVITPKQKLLYSAGEDKMREVLQRVEHTDYGSGLRLLESDQEGHFPEADIETEDSELDEASLSHLVHLRQAWLAALEAKTALGEWA